MDFEMSAIIVKETVTMVGILAVIVVIITVADHVQEAQAVTASAVSRDLVLGRLLLAAAIAVTKHSPLSGLLAAVFV